MATFPQYTSKNNIQADIPSPMTDNASAPHKNEQLIVGTLQKITQAWSDANDVMEYTEAKTKHSKSIAEIQVMASDDPDFENSDKYYKMLEDAKNNSLSVISNKMAQKKAAMEMDFGNTMAAIKIDESFKQKKMLLNEINLEEFSKSQAEKKSNTFSQTEKMQIDADMFDIIQKNIASGVITKAKGKNLLDAYRLGAIDLDIMKDNAISKENSYVYSELLKGKNGAYPDLTDDERADRLENTELHVRRNKYLNNYVSSKEQDNTEKSLLQNFGSNDITEGSIKNLLVNLGIRKDFGEKYLKAFYELPAEKTDYKVYNKIKMMQLNGSADKSINEEVVTRINKITEDDRNSIIKSSYSLLDPKTIELKASAQALGEWAEKMLDSIVVPKNESSEIVYNFFKQVENSPNANIESVLKDVQKNYVKKFFQSTTLLNDIPNIIGNRNKIISVYKKESKMGGKKQEIKPLSTVYQSMDIGFDDL